MKQARIGVRKKRSLNFLILGSSNSCNLTFMWLNWLNLVLFRRFIINLINKIGYTLHWMDFNQTLFSFGYVVTYCYKSKLYHSACHVSSNIFQSLDRFYFNCIRLQLHYASWYGNILYSLYHQELFRYNFFILDQTWLPVCSWLWCLRGPSMFCCISSTLFPVWRNKWRI